MADKFQENFVTFKRIFLMQNDKQIKHEKVTARIHRTVCENLAASWHQKTHNSLTGVNLCALKVSCDLSNSTPFPGTKHL